MQAKQKVIKRGNKKIIPAHKNFTNSSTSNKRNSFKVRKTFRKKINPLKDINQLQLFSKQIATFSLT